MLIASAIHTEENLKAAFIEFYREHRRLVCALCRAYTFSESYVEDLCQEVFAAMWCYFASGRQPLQGNIRGWVYRVTVNTIFTHYRHHRRRLKMEILLSAPLWNTLEDITPLPDDEDPRLPLLDALEATLPPEDAELLLLYKTGLSLKDMAAQLHLTETTVGTRIYRIKKKLQKEYKNIEHDEEKRKQ